VIRSTPLPNVQYSQRTENVVDGHVFSIVQIFSWTLFSQFKDISLITPSTSLWTGIKSWIFGIAELFHFGWAPIKPLAVLFLAINQKSIRSIFASIGALAASLFTEVIGP
jgi:hypothetical protein